jgi:hypothetical protein
MNRRQLLKALGLGSVATLAAMSPLSRRRFLASAESATPPTRIVFFVTAHGHTPLSWNMPVPNVPDDQIGQRPLVTLARQEFSDVLRPLHGFRDRLIVTEGLANVVNVHNIAQALRSNSDSNNHSIAVAGLLTGDTVQQNAGLPCTGGARSVDQELAIRTAGPGRFGSRVYGFDYSAVAGVSPFSFLGAGQAAPKVADPQVAFNDLLGLYVPPVSGEPLTRAQQLNALRPSVLNAVAKEYEFLAPRLDKAGQLRLEQHRQFVRELELNLGAGPSATCDPTYQSTGDATTQFMRLIKLAFACDLTRVATFIAPVPECTAFGYPADNTVHRYAHRSVAGGSTCGAVYDPTAAQAMSDLGIWYANHFAYLLEQLDSVVEGNGTMLDNTAVVWLTELGAPTHYHHDVFAVVAGGGSGKLRTGQYVRYPRLENSPISRYAKVGPAHNRLLVSMLRVMGQSDETFGLPSVTGDAGNAISFAGVLPELLR